MIQAICWGLIHSLWQGLLLAVAAGCVIFCTKRSTAAVRYRLLCGLFLLFLAAGGVTFFYELYRAEESGAFFGGVYPLAANAFMAQVDGLSRYCSEHALLIVSVWFILFSVKSVRMAAAWGYVQHLRREGSVAAPAVWPGRVNVLCGQLGIRQTVKLVESGLVRVPMVIGQLRPVIFIPLGLINHLPAGEMEAVLLHELAHIRRYDYVVNFLQQIAECLFFFNPGLLWISSLLREERENCCDDIAIARTRDRVEFVRALVRFKEHSLRGGLQGSSALAFPAGKRQLLHRVLRISQQQNKMLNGGERLFLLGSCLVLAVLFFSLHRPGGKEGDGDRAAKAGMAMVANPAVAEGGSKELIAVLQTREQVTKNLEWVEQQLNRLHHTTAKGKTGQCRAKRDAEPVKRDPDQEQDRLNSIVDQQNKEQSLRNQQQTQANLELVERERERQQAVQEQEQDRGQAVRDRGQAVKDREQAVRDREQAQRDREQAVKDREQAQRGIVQAIKDRHQADLDRMQAEKDRVEAEKDRVQAELSRQQAVKDQPGEKDQPAEKKKA
jgi:bla regulator protein BlaR1